MGRSQALLLAAWTITGIVVAASALFAQLAPPAGPLFDARCGGCHTLADVRARVGSRAAEARAGFLLELLSRHFPPPEADRSAIASVILEGVP